MPEMNGDKAIRRLVSAALRIAQFQLGHGPLTYDAGDGTRPPMMMATSGHTSVRSPAKYAKASAG
jgi:hypothetical protein